MSTESTENPDHSRDGPDAAPRGDLDNVLANPGAESRTLDPLFEFTSIQSSLAAPLSATDPPAPPKPPADPWAHRRGEPRLFAFFWTFYVLLAVAGSVTWLARAGVVTPGTYGPAARIMLVVVAVGMVVLWPMTRLSQASSRRPSVFATLADLFVVQLPIQIVVWPLYVLANWPADIVMVLSALMGAWGVLAGGVLALALGGRPVTMVRDPRLAARAAWMVVFLGLVLAAPLAHAVIDSRGGAPPPGWLAMASPITAISALTGRGLIGPGAPASTVQWDAIVGTLSIGVFAWAMAAARNGLARGEAENARP